MPDMFNLTQEMNEYFHSLPQNVQSNIIHSGAKINSLADLKQVVKEFGVTDAQKEWCGFLAQRKLYKEIPLK